MKSMKKILALILAMTMVMGLVACGNQNEPVNDQPPADNQQTPDDTQTPDEPKVWDDLSSLEYNEQSATIYDESLSEYYEIYQEALAEIENLDLRYALMAKAEAKLLESAVFTPMQHNGGNYAIGRVVPRTTSSISWGYDQDRQHSIVVTNELIKRADRTAMVEKWKELQGTGEYLSWAKDYLVEQGYTLSDTYNYMYTSDPKTWDVMATSEQPTAEPIVQTFSGLVEYDNEDIMQPALAESWEISEDGLTYTFKIRQGLKWVDSQGREVADVKADDFVAGFQHMMDAAGGLEYLADGVVAGAHEYMEGAVEMDAVGVKALDDYTLQYTLCQKTHYFMTMLNYGVFAPLSRSFYESQGGKFGAEFDSADESYVYGTSPSTIAYCGPYLISGFTEKNSINFVANPSYWDAENVQCKAINWKYNDGSEVTKSYTDCRDGVLSACGLNSAALEMCKSEGNFEDYYYLAATDATAFTAFFNMNRSIYTNFNDETKCISAKTDDQKALSKVAMRNQNFRMALARAIDRGAYLAQSKGEEMKNNGITNSYVPGNFVYLENDLTIDVGGTETTFPAGTAYGEMLQAFITADGYNMKVWDPEADDGMGSSDNYDGWYSPDDAKAALDAAVAELAEYGYEISAENPVVLDLPVNTVNESMTNQARALQQCIESTLGGLVKINLVDCLEQMEYYYACFYYDNGAEANYDINTFSGWGPDYGDPSTYLSTFLPEGAGYMTKSVGAW